MIETVCGVVLRSEDQGDYDQRLTLYTREMGKLKAKIVGVKKTVSKLRGLALPFVESRFQIYLHGSRRVGMQDPGKVVGGEILNARPALREEWVPMIQATAFCETLDRLTQTFYPNVPEFDLLRETLDQMETAEDALLVRLRSTLILLKILGYSLRHHGTWRSLSAERKELLTRLGRRSPDSPAFDPEETAELDAVVSGYLALYLPYPLKTQIFQQKVRMAARGEEAGVSVPILRKESSLL